METIKHIHEDFELNLTKYFDMKKFGFSESNIFEFKQSFSQQNFTKYLETICAFLNGQGGFLIFGIEDNLNMAGLSIELKQIDNIILKFDNIISSKKIIGITTSGKPVTLGSKNIIPRLITNSKGKNFIIIKTSPYIGSQKISRTDLEENDVLLNEIRYQIENSYSYYRLGASNYEDKNERFYSQSQLDNKIKQIADNYKNDNNKNIKTFQKTIDKYENDMQNKDKTITQLKSKLTELNDKISLYETNLISPLKSSLDKQITITNNNTIYYQIVKSFFPCFK